MASDETRIKQTLELPAPIRAVRDYAILTLDAQGRVIGWNEGARRMKGWTFEEIEGRHFSIFYPAADREAGRPARQLESAAAQGSVEDEGPRVRKDGTTFWAGVAITALRDPSGAVIGFIKVTRDLSARHRAEEELREARRAAEQQAHERTLALTEANRGLRAEITRHEATARSLRASEAALRASEERYRRMVETTTQGVWTIDGEGVTTFVNRQLAAMVGWTPEELVGRPGALLLAEDERAAAYARLAERRAGKAGEVDLKMLRRDGSTFWALLSSSPLPDGRGGFSGAVVMVSDVTARKRGEEASARLAAVVQSSADPIVTADPSGRLTSWNRAAERLFGWTAAEAVGLRLPQVLPPGKEAEAAEVLRRLEAGEERVELDTFRLRKDGAAVEVRLSASLIHTAAGGSERLVTLRDLTAERQAAAALRRSQEQLRQAQKMQAIGRLAGGVAHDFNNILSVILGYGGLLLGELPEDSPHRDEVEQIQQAAGRAADLTRQLLVLSRQQTVEPRVVDLNQLAANLEKMLRRLLGEDVALVFRLGRPLGRVRADPSQLEQVILNLVVNARDAMPGGGRLTLETGDVVLDEEYARLHLGARAGRQVMLAVSDTGCGMDEAVQAHLFEPFFTTKEKGHGTGLGLSTVFGIVQQAGGSIWVYSEPGRGSAFKIYLPPVDAEPDADAPAVPAPRAAPGRTVLLVEDDARVRGVAARILAQAGYRVLEHAGAAAALAAAAEAGPIDLLLTDVVMPEVGGPELAQRMRALRPGLRVLFMSGYTEHGVVRGGLLDGGHPFLQKPLTPEALLRKVAEVLDADPAC